MNGRQWAHWLWRRLREAALDNRWMLPAVGGLSGWLLAILVGTDVPEDGSWVVSVDRSRDSLTGALGLVFTSLSIVLAVASVAAQNVVSRFGSRVMRIYIRRSPSRLVIALFVMTAAFILTEQFQLRRFEPDSPAPVGGLTLSVILVVLSASSVIWYITSVIRWFRVDRAVAGVVTTTRHAYRAVGRKRREGARTSIPARPAAAVDVPASRHGHLADVDANAILERCRAIDATVVIDCPIGAPVIAGEPIGWMASRNPGAELQPEVQVLHAIDISETRELAQSIEYGLFALVDIAIIALSPAVNDPNSAAEVIEEMTFVFQDLAHVSLGSYALPDADSWPCVLVRARTFGELVELATVQIVLYGITDPVVVFALRRFADSLARLDLDDSDRAHVDAFAAKLEGAASI